MVESTRFDVHLLWHGREFGGHLLLAGIGDPVWDEPLEPDVGLDAVGFAKHADVGPPHWAASLDAEVRRLGSFLVVAEVLSFESACLVQCRSSVGDDFCLVSTGDLAVVGDGAEAFWGGRGEDP